MGITPFRDTNADRRNSPTKRNIGVGAANAQLGVGVKAVVGQRPESRFDQRVIIRNGPTGTVTDDSGFDLNALLLPACTLVASDDGLGLVHNIL